MEIIGYSLAAIVGISLGLIGSGGSILTVPILIYIMGVEPVISTAYSLFIVGSTALVGGLQSALQKKVDFKTVLIYVRNKFVRARTRKEDSPELGQDQDQGQKYSKQT